jgi:hypothetical protein
MPTPTRDDYDGSIHAQVERARAADLGDVGLPGHGVAVAGRQGGRGALRTAEVQHGAGRVLARRLEPRRPPRAAGSRRAARRPPGQTGQGTPAAGRGAISTRRTDGYRFEMLRLRAEPAFVRPADGIPVPSVNVRCRTSNPIPASSQQPGSNAGFPQTYGSQSIVSLRSCRHVRCVAAQRTSGLAQAVYQHGRRLAEIDRRRSGWTVNPSAYAYRGSNAAAGLDIWATYR